MVLALALHHLWLPLIAGFLIVSDRLQPADALLPLAGDIERIDYAMELFRDGYAHWFVVTNMPTTGDDGRYADHMRDWAITSGVPRRQILEAPGTSTSTYEEAVNVRRLAQQQGWHALIVVTSSYHTRRARIILHDVFRDTDIAITVIAVHVERYRPESWWKTDEGRWLTLSEYLKLALYLCGYR
jgi:uncharacterized SAM-binding protein YcdF (DUF218 family)